MICISVTPESRRLAKADLLNASRQGDLIELCLDHLVKSPDISDLVDAVEKPILVTCRRSQDGGQWTGDEDERLQLDIHDVLSLPHLVLHHSPLKTGGRDFQDQAQPRRKGQL